MSTGSIDGPSDFIETNITGTFNLLEAPAPTDPRRKAGGLPFHHISTDEVFGSLGPEGQFTEETPYDPRLALFRLEGRLRPPGPCLGRDLRAARRPDQLLEQLRPLPTFRKADPGRDPERAAWAPDPGLRQGRERPRLALCRGPRGCAAACGPEEGAVGRSYNIGGENERRNIDLVRTICALLDEMAPKATPYADQITSSPTGPATTPAYAIDPLPHPRGTGQAAKRDGRGGLRRTVRWYLDNEAGGGPLLERKGVGERLGRALKLLVFGRTARSRGKCSASSRRDLPWPRRGRPDGPRRLRRRNRGL